MNFKGLEEKRNDLITRAEDVLNQAKTEKRELTEDEAKSLAEIRDNVRMINETLKLDDDFREMLDGEEKKDDLASMKEVLYRRYYRNLVENLPTIDLLIVDGGLNQVNIAKETLSSLGFNNVAIAGLVKDNNHRTRGLINSDGEELLLPNDHALLFFLTRMQDEVHRFAISYHHDLRSKSLSSSFLDSIDGIGPKRKELLLKTFGSIKKIKEAPLDELTQYIPLEIAKKIKEHND